MYIHDTLVNRSLWNDEWPRTIFRSLWPIFHDPVILFNISNTIRHINTILVLMGHCATTNDIYRQVSVTYISWLDDFGVKITPTLLNVYISYFG